MLHRDVLVVRTSTLNKPYKQTNQRTWTGTQKDMLTNHSTYVDRKTDTPHTHTQTCCSNIGSKAGSSSSATFSSKHGLPNLTQFSRLLRKSLSVNFNTSTLWSFSCRKMYKHNKVCIIKNKCLVENMSKQKKIQT